MNHQIALISAVLVSVTISSVHGYKEKGMVIPPPFSDRIEGKLNVILQECSTKGVEFDVAEVPTKVGSCIQQLNDFGRQEKEYPDIEYPEDWENEEQIRAYRAQRKTESKLRLKYFCEQVSSGLQCLSPLKSIFDQCQSSEGITLFAIGEEMCSDDGQPLYDLTASVDTCARGENFRSTFETCAFGEQGNGLEKYIGGGADFFSYVDEFCNLLSLARECFQRSIDAEPEACAETSKILQDFTKGAYSRASNAEAASQCIR